jgi:hypothetical protein
VNRSSVARRRAPQRENQRGALKQLWEQNKDLPLPDVLISVGEVNRDWVEVQLEDLEEWDRLANAKKITGEDVDRILNLAVMATEDPDFRIAIGAWRRHGLGAGSLKVALRRCIRAQLLAAYVRLVEEHVQAGCTVREAAENVVATYRINGPSFETVVDELRTAYRRRG